MRPDRCESAGINSSAVGVLRHNALANHASAQLMCKLLGMQMQYRTLLPTCRSGIGTCPTAGRSVGCTPLQLEGRTGMHHTAASASATFVTCLPAPAGPGAQVCFAAAVFTGRGACTDADHLMQCTLEPVYAKQQSPGQRALCRETCSTVEMEYHMQCRDQWARSLQCSSWLISLPRHAQGQAGYCGTPTHAASVHAQ